MNEMIHHALVLNFHQPAGNLEDLLENNHWEAKEILYAMDRMPRSLWNYKDIARVHLSFSGTLLETLSSALFQETVYGIVKCGDFLWQLQNEEIFNILGTSYYHAVFPLIPPADWQEQLGRWQGIAKHLFHRDYFGGFWPAEMGFCMEMIPKLKAAGYRYVLVDSLHVEPITEMSWQELRYRPHIARYGDSEIVVVVRDRELSDAQESGMDYGWFAQEVNERVKFCDFPPLVTTATDGDNGGWFRNTSEKGNFWHVFYQAMLDKVKSDETNIRPTFIDDYLDRYGTHGEVNIAKGAWNTGWHNGCEFIQWTGSEKQKDTLHQLWTASNSYHDICSQLAEIELDDSQNQLLEDAHWHLLRAETSCNFYWGEAWVYKCQQDLDSVWNNLDELCRQGLCYYK
jgi:alpha-amylase/alpha-mannosidase (GH57 family)